jgi:predicted nucleotidyltransferase
MANRLPPDFKEFLVLLEQNNVEYLLIGGYAVGLYGYPRATFDMDIFISTDPINAQRLVQTLEQFGMPGATLELFTTPSSIIRMGIKPTQLEITNFIDGVTFAECFADRVRNLIDGLEVNVISLEKLRKNKLASGRTKDLADLENLPETEI